MANSYNTDLLEGNVFKSIIKLTVPMMFGHLSLVLSHLVHTFFIGKLGVNQLAALGFIFPVSMAVIGIAIGLGIGASSTIARAIGRGDSHEVQRIATDNLSLAILTILFLSYVGILTINPLFSALGASEEILTDIQEYMIIWYPGAILLFIHMVGNSAIRATGDTKIASIMLMMPVLLTIALDPLFIFGFGPIPGFGLKGVAIAIIVSRTLTLFPLLYILIKVKNLITFEIPPTRVGLESWKEILYIAIPSSFTTLVSPIATGIVTSFVASYGNSAVAAIGISFKLESLAVICIISLAASLTPFIGQNWGAGNLERVKEGLRVSSILAVSWGIFTFILFYFFAKHLATIFTSDPETIANTTLFLLIVPFSFAFRGIFIVAGSVFNAINKPLNSSALGVVRMVILYLPLSFLGSYYYGLIGIFLGMSIANTISGIIAFIWLKHFSKKELVL